MAVAAAALFVCVWCLSTGPGWTSEETDARLILFYGQDIWRSGAFLYVGLIWAPRGVDHDGLLLKALLAGGQYRYSAGDLGDANVIGIEGLVAIMPGWRVKRGAVEVKVFFGPELQQHRLSPDDPGNELRGRSLGLRFATDIWAEPTAATMIAGDASLSSIGGNNSADFMSGRKCNFMAAKVMRRRASAPTSPASRSAQQNGPPRAVGRAIPTAAPASVFGSMS